MPEAKMVLVEVIKDEGRSRQPKTACELSNLFPPAQANQFQLRQRKHR
jgi:hypothetical protein